MADGSKYVKETAEGYLGVHRVSAEKASLSLGMFPIDWDADTNDVYGVPAEPGVRLTVDEPDGDDLGRPMEVNTNGVGPSLAVNVAVLDELGVDNGDDIRVYEDGDALRVVPADPDPMLEE